MRTNQTIKQKLYDQLDQIMSIYVTQKHIVFEPDTNQTLISSKLLIERHSHRLSELKITDKTYLVETTKKVPIFGVLGFIKIYGKLAVVYIEQAELVCVIQEAPIFLIKKVAVLLLDTKENDEMLDIQEKQFIHQLTRALQTSFYFSYLHDLTQHTQGRYQLTQNASTPVKQNSQRYWWNHNMLKNFTRDGIPDYWHLRVIQGFVASFQNTFKNNKQLQCVLLSRTQYHRSGNYNNHKGINEEGQVANHVETEQIILYDTFRSSLVLLRGSIPLFWDGVTLSDQVILTSTEEQQKKAYTKHINNLLSSYGKVACVNLVGKERGATAILSQTFENLQHDNRFENVGYEQFDFDEVCKEYKFEQLNFYLEKMSPIINYFNYFLQDNKLNKVKLQKGVFRMNCLDCLDRTNIYMTRVALRVVQDILEEMGISTQQEFNCESLVQQADQPSLQNQHPFLVYFKQQWSDNGDQIARHYQSHINLTTQVTQERYYQMNFDDTVRQDVLDQMLGMHVQTSSSLTNIKILEQMLKQREQDFLQAKQVSVYVVTWNINAHVPNNLHTNDFMTLFDMRGNQPPELIAVAFQELVTLNAMNVVGNNNQTQIDSWRKIIESTVHKQVGEYVVVATSDMVGCLLLILVKKDLQGKITNIETDAVKCGFKSQLGNKGGVVSPDTYQLSTQQIIKMSFHDSVVCFINCHLPAGQKESEARLQAIHDIHEKAFQQDKLFHQDKLNPDNCIKKFDWVIFTGDTNFRVNLPYQQTIDYMNKYHEAKRNNMKDSMNNIFNTLRDNDQLKVEQRKSSYLKHYQEAKIQFMPTYKYDIGSDVFDTSKKARVPSWTDRVMFCTQSVHPFASTFYDKLEGPFQISDHRPVGCYIKTSVSQVQEANKDRVFQEILQNSTEVDHKWSEKYFDKSPLINGRGMSMTSFVSQPTKRQGPRSLRSDPVQQKTILTPSSVGGKRPQPDLEELTNPFN